MLQDNKLVDNEIMTRRFLYKRSGEYWGYIFFNNIYDKNNNYKGWIEEKKFVWDENGKYLGELIDKHYIMKNINEIGLINKVPPERIEVNFRVLTKKNKMEKLKIKNWRDSLK